MKKKARAFLAQIVSTAMAASMVLPMFPTLNAKAAIQTTVETVEAAENHEWGLVGKGVFEKRNTGGEKWLHVESGANDKNDDFSNDNPQDDTMVLKNANAKVTADSEVSMEINIPGTSSTNRFAIYPKFVDAKNWVYVGFNASGWYYQYMVDGTGGYSNLKLALPTDGATIKLSVSLKGKDISVKAGEETAAVSVEALAGLSAKEGCVALKAGSFVGKNGLECTNINFRNVIVNGAAADKAWTSLAPKEGQVFKEISVGGVDSLHLESTEENDNNLDSHPAIITDNTVEKFQDGSVEFTVSPDESCTDPRVGVAFRYTDTKNWCYVGYQQDAGWFYEYKANGAGTYRTKLDESVPAANTRVKVTFTGNKLKIDLNGRTILQETAIDGMETVPAGTVAFKAGTYGKTTSVDITDITYSINHYKEVSDPVEVTYTAPDTIISNEMEVGIDNVFPRVAGYTLKGGELDGKKFYGQTEQLSELVLNRTQKSGTGMTVTPEVEYTKVSNSQAKYVMHVNEKGIEADITATLTVSGRELSFDITEIKNISGEIVKTIEIPNHNLVAVRDNQTGAAFAGSNMSTNTHKNGDTYAEVKDMQDGIRGYMYAFVSADGLSAGLWSNSENNVSADWQRVTAVASSGATEKGSYKQMGLSSTYWTYQKGEEYRAESTPGEMPSTKIVITGDENSDSVVDWQDGAIAYRNIMNIPQGAELVPDRVAMRIAMNFSSQAQNPFLMTLDNVKKVYLNTDGLGQSVLLKGYGSEGHDSGHLNYADIGTRIGGVEDMATLLNEGAKIGATFGIHVNASETYAESKYFTEDRLKKDGNGNYSYGWNWLDQGININADYDLRNGRGQRFQDLKDKLDEAGTKLDFIYVDVWGNGQSGDNGTWASRQLAKEITNCGWRVAGEWGHANEYDSTFQHWAADLTYGGYNSKGINSNIARFIRNHEKDSWVGDYPSYGGAAVNPLLGGYDMKDFEGWQGRNDYEGYIKNLFDDDVATKFVQHFQVVKWENGTPVNMSDNGETYSYTPEMKVTLQDDSNNTLVIERQSNDVSAAGYRLRTMTYNGTKIMDGEKYLIPWFWDANGKKLAADDQKLYHWNQAGGTTEWSLPSDWNVSSVKVYTLTENGKADEKSIPVSNGKVSLEAEASTPYVIYKGDAAPAPINVEWSTGMHIKDSGFNSSAPLDYWEITGNDNVSIIKSAASNNMLALSGEASATQELTGLTPGRQYAAYVGVDNRSDAKAYIKVNANGAEASNYTEKSIAENYIQAYAHNTNAATVAEGGSYFQNMYVYFTAPESGKVTLTLSREAGVGTTYFDDIRICENSAENYETENRFVQDFEKVAQGIYPFVCGPVEGVTDNRTHLSEFHAPYTQYGWNEKKVNDVIEGNWSLKTNGLVGRNSLVYQTIPQNFRFEPGVTYNVSFDYETGSDDTYAFVVGDGEYSGADSLVMESLKKTGAEDVAQTPADATSATKGKATGSIRLRVNGSESGQTWIGIYSTANGADTQGDAGGAADFRGYKDFILDNLVIEKSKAQKAELENLVNENSGRYEVNYSADTWKKFTGAMATANNVLEDFEAEQKAVDDAKAALEAAIGGLKVVGATLSGQVTDGTYPLEGIAVTAQNEQGAKLTAVTGADGKYVIPGILFGTWKVTAENGSYTPVTEEIQSAEEKLEIVHDFALTQAVTNVTGKVVAVGESQKDVTVSLATQDGKTQETTTDKNGNFVFRGVAAGESTITANADGYDAYTKTFTSVKEKDAVANIELMPVSGADYESDYTGANANEAWDNLSGNTSSTTIAKGENDDISIKFPGGGHANVYEKLAPKFQNGCVEMDLTSTGSGVRLGILLRANGMGDRVYVGVGDSNNQWFSEYWGNNAASNSWSGMSAGPAFTAGTTLHLKAEVVGTTVKLWVDGELVLSNEMSGMPTAAGYMGLNTRNGNTVTVKNVKVTSYDEPEGDVRHIVGRITKDGVGVEGATVVLSSAADQPKARAAVEQFKPISKKTDANGNYIFKNVPLGNYKVEAATADGSGLGTKEITIEAGAGSVIAEPFATGNVPAADKSELETLYNTCLAKYQEEKYTPDSWQNYQKALAQAKAVMDSQDANSTEITMAIVHLNDAVGALEARPDKTGLDAVIKAAEKYVAFKDKYTEESWNAFEAALTAAKGIFENAAATEEEVRAATNTLIEAERNLVLKAGEDPEVVDKTALIAAITEAQAVGSDNPGYTQESWAAFQNALSYAIQIRDKNDAVSTEIADAASRLSQAKASLAADKSGLIAAYVAAQSRNEADYTPETWAVLKTAMSQAEAVIADKNASIDAVKSATQGVLSAVDQLKTVSGKDQEVNKDELKQAIENASQFNQKKYTAESWKAFEKALAEAKAVVNDKNATKEKVALALNNLVNAQNNLKEVPAAENTNKNTAGQSEKANASKTGDTSPVAGMVLLLFAAVVLGAAAVRKRKIMN